MSLPEILPEKSGNWKKGENPVKVLPEQFVFQSRNLWIYFRYDFVGVLQWFAERVDRIILLFDANKLDISDEFRRSIEAIHGYEDKVRIILNKADQVDHHELMRVYGALMWSIAKVINVPECPKVFVGSFWDQQLKHDLYRKLFERELQALFDDLQDLPKYAALRKINDFIKVKYDFNFCAKIESILLYFSVHACPKSTLTSSVL